MIKLKNIVEDIQSEADGQERPMYEHLKLTRIEEGEALQYINRVLLPKIVETWNRRLDPTLDLVELNKNLKKIDSGVDKMNAISIPSGLAIGRGESVQIPYEYVIYETHSSFHKSRRFVFTIYKTLSGSVQVKTKSSHISVPPMYVGKPPVIFENTENESSISKMEEQFILNYINRKIIPDTIDTDYNKLLTQYPNYPPDQFPRIGYPTLRKNLKKISRQVDGIVYEVRLTPRVSFRFRVIKGFFGITVTVETQFAGVHIATTYNVDISKFNTDVPHIQSQRFDEVSDQLNEHFSLNKQEEMESLQFVRRVIVPNAVKAWNDRSSYEIKEQDVLKNLVKLHERRLPNYLDVHSNDSVTYISIVHSTTEGYHFPSGIAFKFIITKDGDGEMIVGFENPIINGSWYKVRKPDMKIQEVGNTQAIDRTISKESEMRGLQYIRRIIIPDFVEDWNKKYKKKIKEQDVNHKLIKKQHMTWPTGSKLTDYVEYEYVTPLKDNTVSFKILKNREGELGVTYNIVVSDKPDRGFIGGSYTIGRGDLKESQNLIEDIEELSRKEELYAINFLQRKLMPTVLNEKYNRYLRKYPSRYPERKYPRITEKDINVNLKKVRKDIQVASYESVIDDEVFFAFHIEKRDGIVIVGVLGPMNTDWSWYRVEGASNLQESVKKSPYAISKLEEFYALDFIKRKIIPIDIEHRDETSVGYTGEPLVNFKDVFKTLKKVGHDVGNERIREVIWYQVLINGEPYKYGIYKRLDGQLLINKISDGTVHVVTTKK